MLESMIDDPCSDDEHVFAQDFYASKFDGRRIGACTELLRANGHDYKTLEDNGTTLVVARLECRFRAPARYDDELLLTTCTGKIDRVRLEHIYKLERPADGRLVAEGRTVLVHIDKEGKLQALPEFLHP